MSNVTNENVLAALRGIAAPGRRLDVVAAGMIQGLQVKDGHVGFALQIDASVQAPDALRRACEKAVFDLPGVLSASAVVTAHQPPQPPRPAPPPQQAARAAIPPKAGIPGVKAILAVASGKGGVGKSTSAVNIALAFARLGRKVGLMDADIYGPSLPRMMGLSGRPDSKDGKTIEPKEAYGVKCMSIGFMVPDDTPTIWRGPMVMAAVEQLLREVNWGELDILVCDLPPGTGDAQLTMAQRVPLAGAVIISTPQEVALSDVRKGLNMFRKVDVPVFGIVENMSFYLCPSCGHRADIFGHGGARQTAQEMGCDFLGEIPLHLSIREHADAGTPIVASEPDSPYAQPYLDIARKLLKKIDAAAAPSGPAIVME
jgi:ATP-binding protein involved in chromosome partitioning